MKSLSANEVKTQFGDVLLRVQREPVQINRNGKPVAVMLSIEDYQMLEEVKMRLLKEKVSRAEADIARGDVMDGETFFAQLMSGKRD
ncbi:type II toxin-antitoxin system Phd/YefM family antitoxin [Rahnella variigena]|jgi:prevent-host-death family protein|uniref:Antitoxin n=1 Tax=Rahnella variigena TaxID=574964 RepID=A0ABX9PQV3_9GAMM|nr:type II toxin-antitoxin system Phd/YefM family antitoxin [Rahnella variigena]RJT51516.1 type II toxin-antitoxin system Phd/YefM family antitoxin [Rahnella variigena]RKF67404.1 antitoxin [Rahnella variigena]RYJ15959.1 antitoxin [Rahnella variigena]